MTIETQRDTAREEMTTIEKPDTAPFNSLLDLNSILVPDLKTRLLLSKPPIHQVEAGLNPLVDAAAYIFTTLGQLIHTRSYDDLGALHTNLVNKVNDFQAAIQFLHYSKELLSEYVPVSTYILCTTMDDIISNTSWGNQEKWLPYRLLTLYDKHILPRESLLIILERYIHDPDLYIDMIEFIFICFNLSFKYMSHSSGFTAEQLQKIMHALHQHIYAYRGVYRTHLSPSTIRARPIHYSKKNWFTTYFPFIKKMILSKEDATSQYDQTLLRHFKHFLHTINENSITTKSAHIKLNTLPFTLYIGANGAGKTTLIEQSQIKFFVKDSPVLSSVHPDERMIHPSYSKKSDGDEKEFYQWQASPSSILIDVNGRCFHRNRENTYDHFEQLIDLLYLERQEHAIASVALCIPFRDMINKDKRRQIVIELSHRIKQLQEKFSLDLFFHLIVTKCDHIPGFLEFFSLYDQHELSQVFGANLPSSASAQVIMHAFNTRFNQLIKTLNKQLIYHLQQTKDYDVDGKFLIKGFPIEIQSLKEEMNEVIKDLLTENLFLLKGFYLTSATQNIDKKNTDVPQVFSANEFLQTFNMMNMPLIQKHAYFVKQLLLYGLT